MTPAKTAAGAAFPQGNRTALPTMYDLPSECAEDPGLPNEFHALQPRLLDNALALADYPRDRWFSGTDMHLYYDARNPKRYKRPDWFLVVGVPRMYEGQDIRQSYVVWQEQAVPRIAIEFLSPGTEAEDLGRFHRGKRADSDPEKPPGKFVVYEEILQIPHYVTYDRVTQELRYFRHAAGCYQEQSVGAVAPRIWFPDLQAGLGIWEGTVDAVRDRWLRWCDAEGNWLLTEVERERQAREFERARMEAEKERERQRAERAEAEKDRMAAKLRELGIAPDGL